MYTCPDSFEVDANGKLRLGMPLPHVELISKITGVAAFNAGKPNANMAVAGLRLINQGRVSKGKVLMVGDSLDTDIRLATENGIDSALILSAGATSREKLARSCLKPNFVFESVKDFSLALPSILGT
jgi:ribonucleotide monophosphatase NagD (HAD superfamily)